MRTPTAFFTILLFCCSAAAPIERVSVCGTHRDRWRDELHLHQKAEARRKAEQRRRAAYGAWVATPLAAATTDIGNIAVMEDSGGIISRVNNFDLHGKILTFSASNLEATQYKHGIGDGGYDKRGLSGGDSAGGFGR